MVLTLPQQVLRQLPSERNVNSVVEDPARGHKRVRRCSARGAVAGKCCLTVARNVVAPRRLQMFAEMLPTEARTLLIRELLIRMVSDVGYDARCSVLIGCLCKVRGLIPHANSERLAPLRVPGPQSGVEGDQTTRNSAGNDAVRKVGAITAS